MLCQLHQKGGNNFQTLQTSYNKRNKNPDFLKYSYSGQKRFLNDELNHKAMFFGEISHRETNIKVHLFKLWHHHRTVFNFYTT